MRIFLVLFFSICLSISPVYGKDHKTLEIELKEAPIQLLQEIKQSITLPISANSLAEFEKEAQDQGYQANELKHKIQLLSRLYLNTNIKAKDKYKKAETLLAVLESVSTSPFDQSYLLILKGRHLARTTHDYKQALPLYNQALNLIENNQDLPSLILKQLGHFHLGSLHRILRQDQPALVHLKLYRETAYKLRDDYLIAHAEAALGNFYNKREKLSLALQHYSEALRLSNRQDKPFLKADLQLQLARVYRDLESWDEALQYAHNADEAFKNLDMDRLRSHCMTVIAMVHANQGLWNQAIDYYLNAQQLDYKEQNLTAQALNYHNLGEAYFNNGDTATALALLFKSNAIFTARKSNHYLIYSNLLIAEITLADEQWLLAEKHSNFAVDLANKLSLVDEKMEALQYLSHALRGAAKYDKAFTALDKLIELGHSQRLEQNEQPTYTTSVLAEQKLKLEVSKLKTKQDQLKGQISSARVWLITAIILGLLMALVAVNQWRRKKYLIIDLIDAKENQILEPVSGLPGYQGLIQELETKPAPDALALLSLTGQLNADIKQGFQCNNDMNKMQLEALQRVFEGQVYLIRPGLFMLSIREVLTPKAILSRCRSAIDENHGDTHFHLGILPLPLLMDPEIKLPADVYYGAAQMSLAGAQSLGHDKDYYVAMKALNFAPVAIFSTPLYLHLEKGIARGLLKVDTNGQKKEIIWPRWKSHGNIDIAQLDQ